MTAAAFSSIIEQFYTTLLPHALQVAFFVSPVILLMFLAGAFWELWLDYIRSKGFLAMKYTVLEIRLPKETNKSPAAMEIFLNSLHNTSDGSTFAQYWKGETRPWYSLEIVSIEGQVKFMIWTEDRRKGGVMSALYSQFPEIQIKEIDDYTKSVHFDPDKIRVWAAEFEFTKPDPYPIKTYIDYGLHEDPKEEFKVDPLLPLLEFLGSLGPNQQMWVQIPIRGHKDDQHLPGHLFKKGDLWKKEGEKLVNQYLERGNVKEVNGKAVNRIAGVIDDKGFLVSPTLTKGEQEVVFALEKSLGKLAFDSGIRAIYIAKKEVFNNIVGIGGILSSLKQFSSQNLNGFKPYGKKWHPSISDPWQDYKNMRRNRFSKAALKAYKRRSFFYQPYKGKVLVMNTEELATIFHFPGSVAQTPTLNRIESKRAQAPGNLPT